MNAEAVRPGKPSDIEACVELAILSSAGEGVGTDAAFWYGALARDVEELERHLVVAMSDNEIVGYARAHLFEPEPDAPSDRVPRGYYLLGLFVLPSHRRLGLGSTLTSARLRWIGERASEAWFFSNARNTASIELHGRLGFTEVTRSFSFPGLAFEGGEGVLFRLQLQPPE
jgi:ribosomal protein S18 acetylase RimI-like enzyme